MKQQTAIKIILAILFLSIGYVSAANYYMPRETLKTDLRLRDGPSVTSKTTCRVGQFTSLRRVHKTGRWYKVIAIKCTGWVSQSSVVAFQTQLPWAMEKVAEDTTAHTIGNVLYFSIPVGFKKHCFFVNLNELNEIPEGKENAITLMEYLNERGGLDGLTQEIHDNCNF